MARLRRLAMMRGPLAVRTWERSSSKSRSRTQCSRSSMPQWPRMMAASWAEAGLGHGQRGDRVAGFARPLPFQFAAAHDLDGLGGMGEGQAPGYRGDLEGAPLGAAVAAFPLGRRPPGRRARAGRRAGRAGWAWSKPRGAVPWAGRFRAAPPRTGRASFPASRLSGGATAFQAAGGCWRGSGRRRSGFSAGWLAWPRPTVVRPSCCIG